MKYMCSTCFLKIRSLNINVINISKLYPFFCCVIWLPKDGTTHTLKEYINFKMISSKDAQISSCKKNGKRFSPFNLCVKTAKGNNSCQLFLQCSVDWTLTWVARRFVLLIHQASIVIHSPNFGMLLTIISSWEVSMELMTDTC